MRLLVGIIVSGFPMKVVPVEFWKSYEQLAARIRQGPAGLTYYEMKVSDGFPTDVARNQVVRYMLTQDFDALLFLDADHVFDRDLFERLAAHDKPVITARYHQKRKPFHPNVFVKHPLAPAGQFKPVHYGQGCFEIDRAGAGALLIQRPVLEAIGADWFRYQRNPNPDEPPDFTVSEDFWFFEQAQAHGFSCWCDWDLEVRHLMTVEVGKAMHDEYLIGMEREMTDEIAQGLVVCGFDAPLQVAPGYAIEPFRPDAVVETA